MGFTAEELKTIKAVERALCKLAPTVHIIEVADCLYAVRKDAPSSEALYDFSPKTICTVSGGGLTITEMHDQEFM